MLTMKEAAAALDGNKGAKLVTRRHLAKMLHKATSWMAYDTHAQSNMLGKIDGLLKAPRTPEGILSAWLNYPDEMSLSHPKNRRTAEKVIAVLESVRVVH